jgi:hypothetical protein
VFADPTSLHHEAIAEAELDVNDRGSPIVMGDEHGALAPGQRLPDTIDVVLAGGEVCMLHQLTNREGHTALLMGGLSVPGESLARVDSSTRARSGTFLIEATIVLTARSDDQNSYARLAPATADQLGIGGVTLLVIRPDGHVPPSRPQLHRGSDGLPRAVSVRPNLTCACWIAGASGSAKLGVDQM